jgi:CRISPR-associated protein Cmr3
MSQFKSLVTVSPLGFMYASAGGFLSPENLVGKSNYKFPPDAAAIAGLILNANRSQGFADPQILKQTLAVAGPFWAYTNNPAEFYVPMSRHQIIDKKSSDEWSLQRKERTENLGKRREDLFDGDYLNQYRWHRSKQDLKPVSSATWQLIDTWSWSGDEIRQDARYFQPTPWRSTSFLHPRMKENERHVLDKNGLFLENAVQIPDDICLVYLTNLDTLELNGWYRFGGEGHLVEVATQPIDEQHPFNKLLSQKISHAFALITPAVWGSNNLSYRYPQHSSFPKRDLKLLMDKPVPYRYRVGQNKDDPRKGQRLGRGRYAVPSGSVYVFREPLNMTWWDFPEEWFPKEGFSLKQLGCGLCLPVEIQGVPECTTKRSA